MIRILTTLLLATKRHRPHDRRVEPVRRPAVGLHEQRTLLGRVILDEALWLLAALTLANRLPDKREALAEASGRLDSLRVNALRTSGKRASASARSRHRVTCTPLPR